MKHKINITVYKNNKIRNHKYSIEITTKYFKQTMIKIILIEFKKNNINYENQILVCYSTVSLRCYKI